MLIINQLSAAEANEASAPPTSEAVEIRDGPKHGAWGIELQHISKTVHPGDDFYAYVNEGWIKTTSIPADRGYLNEPWEVQGEVLQDVSALLEALFANQPAPQGSSERRLQDFYAAYMNSSQVEELGLEPIRAGLDDISAIEKRCIGGL
ncbi:MAG: M13 family metallopeptidase N-terminal domain-containing protein [Pseudomonadota bacterium]